MIGTTLGDMDGVPLVTYYGLDLGCLEGYTYMAKDYKVLLGS